MHKAVKSYYGYEMSTTNAEKKYKYNQVLINNLSNNNTIIQIRILFDTQNTEICNYVILRAFSRVIKMSLRANVYILNTDPYI